MDTTSVTLPPSPPDVPVSAPERRRRAWWPWILGVAAVVVTGLVVAATTVRVPYYAIGPGGARATEPIIEVEGAPSYQDDADLLFTTVFVDHVTLLGLLDGWLRDDTDVVPLRQIDGDQSPEENQQLNEQLMAASEDTAIQVALEHLGYDVVSGTGATIPRVLPDGPSEGIIHDGETVVRAGGEPVERVEDLVGQIDARRPGDALPLVLEDDEGHRRRVRVELGRFPGAPDEPFLGVSDLRTRDLEVHYPFDVTIDPGQVRGPSAGLAFTLAVLDVLTPGDLSGGHEVAVTGTIDGLGRVGPIGGAEFKAIAAERAGAEVFLVPAGEEDEARARVGDDLRIEPVATLDDALRVLESLGGRPPVLETSVPSGE